MKKYLLLFAPVVLAFALISCSDPYYTQGSGYPDDGYGRYPDNRYPDNRYPDDRYGRYPNNSGYNWTRVASRRVSNTRSYDAVDLGYRNRGFSQLMFEINDQYTQIRRVLVTYSNGRTQELSVRRGSGDRYGNDRYGNRNGYGNAYIVNLPNSYNYGAVRQVAYWVSGDGYYNSRPTVTVYAR